MDMDTETIDKLFLELSQVTKATTKKEKELEKQVDNLRVDLQLLIYDHHRAINYLNSCDSEHRPGGARQAIEKGKESIQKLADRYGLDTESPF